MVKSHLINFAREFLEERVWQEYCEQNSHTIMTSGQKYFLVTEQQMDLIKTIQKNMNSAPGNINSQIQPELAGVYLGEMKGTFKPSTCLLKILAQMSDKKIFLSKKGEWLFLCGRDLFGSAIEKSGSDAAGLCKGNLVLVQNSFGENLGFGVVSADISDPKNKDIVVVKNLLDRGSFLRRETHNSVRHNNFHKKQFNKKNFRKNRKR